MSVVNKVEYLIVDTSAFIKNAPLQEIGNNIVTEQNVVDEIKSKRQLRRLVVLPYDLQIKDADPEHIRFITEFSKKTGDYTSLSSTDIKVMALTYQLEIEHVGKEHLKTEPTVARTIVPHSKAPEDHPKNLAGFYVPNETADGNEVPEDNKEDAEFFDTHNESDLDSESDYETAVSETECVDENDLATKFERLACNPEDLKIEDGERDVDDILPVLKDDDTSSSSEVDKVLDESDDSDGGWITPKNINTIKKQIGSDIVQEKPAKVACLTTDFAMQNVLMQIGLNVASLDGRVIKQMRTFILRCYACFKTTSIMTKVFCPNCGNKTLKRVGVSLDDEGKQQIHINFRKPLTARGKKFSLPTPKGGKHANNPILCEDQPVPDQRPSRLARMKNDPLKDDYIAGYSPFVMRDVNSKSAMLGIRSNGSMKYWMRRNPNEARRKVK